MLPAMKRALIGIGLVLVGCGEGSSDKSAADAGTTLDGGSNQPLDGGTQPGTFKLTSTELAEGAEIPIPYSCKGVNVSPALAWSNPPAAAKSFAVTLIDPDAFDFKHWVIYDIPSTATGLPAEVERTFSPRRVPGAHQVKNQQGSTGYYGPCPPIKHTYHFTVYALDLDKLPGITENTPAADAIAAITTHMIAHTELTGTFTPPP